MFLSSAPEDQIVEGKPERHDRDSRQRVPRLVGRERVIAGSDCGFSSQATYSPEVHPTVIWAKFRALAEGARLASKQLGFPQ